MFMGLVPSFGECQKRLGSFWHGNGYQPNGKCPESDLKSRKIHYVITGWKYVITGSNLVIT
jgi:hypothetical protein